MWVPLKGKLAQSLQSKLHLRIFLDNNNGVDTIKDYLTKVEKEAGKKVCDMCYGFLSLVKGWVGNVSKREMVGFFFSGSN